MPGDPSTYEYRYQIFCRAWMLDPEDPDSVRIYETAWEEDHAADQGPS